MNKIFLGIAAVIVLIGGVYLVSSGTPAASRTSGGSAVPGASSAQAAPAFSLSTIDGGTIALADYRGKKPVILDFWATWCPNCQRDIPHLNAFYQKYKDQVQVIGIDLQEDPSVVKAFAARDGIVYPIALDPNAEASHAYDANYTNFHVLIDEQGNIVKTIPGDISEQDFLSLINS